MYIKPLDFWYKYRHNDLRINHITVLANEILMEIERWDGDSLVIPSGSHLDLHRCRQMDFSELNMRDMRIITEWVRKEEINIPLLTKEEFDRGTEYC